MADLPYLAQFRDEIKKTLGFQQKNLTSRPEWGSIHFEKAGLDYERIFKVASDLNALPLHFLNQDAISVLRDRLTRVNQTLTAIDTFTVTQNSFNNRDTWVNELNERANQFISDCASWIPFLYLFGNALTNRINELQAEATKAQGAVSESQKVLDDRLAQADKVLVRAREASAIAGAAEFTHAFDTEATQQERGAQSWLYASILMAFITIVIASALWWFTEDKLDPGVLVQKFGTKLVILAFMFTATMWCGKMYKALKHQAFANRHRALSLQTFQAFSNAGSDATTKNAVLLEATRAIFTSSQSGYIDQGGAAQESDIKIIEVVKSVISQKP
jgi:hypothetical protein